MKTIIFPLVYKEGTRLIQYPEEPTLFKDCKVIGNEVACNYYGDLDTYEPYVWPGTVTTLLFVAEMSGGDGDSPIGIVNDGVDFVKIDYHLEYEDNSLVPIPDGCYRVTIRDSDNGTYDVISIPFVDGVGSINYTSNMRPAVIWLDPSDLSIPGQNVEFNIENPSTIKVYRSF